MMRQSQDRARAFHIKIIPPDGYSVYRLAFTRRHLAAMAAVAALLLLTAAGVHTWQLRSAEANVRALQSVTAEQQHRLKSIDEQADALSNQLKAVQRENAEIRRLIGADKGKPHAFVGTPHAPGDVEGRLRTLARAAEATRDDAAHLQRVAMRVLNLRRLASIARERLIASIPSLNPVGGAIASTFGYRSSPWPEFHKGLDLEANYGTTVRAAAAGTVASAGWDPGGFGIKVDIDHGNGYHTWYAHLSRVNVTAGQRVTKGMPIAAVGSTGESTGPHLHYQVMHDGTPVDPAPFLGGVPAQVMATLPADGGV